MNVMTHEELIGKAVKLYEDARALLTKAEVSAEDVQAAERMTNEANQLKARASALRALNVASAIDVAMDEPPQAKNFGSWQDYVSALREVVKSKGRKVDPRLQIYKELGSSTGASGGFLVPVQQMNNLMSVSAMMSIVRPRATVLDMTGKSIEMPVLDQTAASTDTPSFFGGIKVNWTEDGATISQSDPKYRDMSLTAYELTGGTTVRNTLLDDAPALASYLGGQLGFPGAIAHAEDYAFLRGNGVGKPLGVINAPATIAVTRTTGGTVKYDDLANMTGRFYGSRPVWVASIALKPTLLLMNGPSGNPSYLWGNATSGMPETLLGYPIMWTDKLPAIGTKGDILLADFSYYLVGNRLNATSVESSDQELFMQNKTTFRIVHRVGGSPWLSAPIPLMDGSTTLSPFVTIAS